MTISKTIITIFSILCITQVSFAGPKDIGSNATPDILVGGLEVETGTHSGSVLNGSSTVYAKNAHSYQGGLCTFKINFSIYNDSPVKPDTFVTTMSYNQHPNVINSYTVLSSANIKNYEWQVQLNPGDNTIHVHADQQNNIDESNELNNKLTKRIKVIGQCSEQKIKLTPKQNIKLAPKQKIKALSSKEPLAPHQAQKDCQYNPDSASLPCADQKRNPTMKLAPKQKIKAPSAKEPQAPHQAQKDCQYDPDSARLGCEKHKPTMKLIDPFE